VICFELYQGKDIGQYHVENVASVGAASGTLMDLIDLIPEEKKNLAYHFFGDNYYSSMKLLDKLTASNNFYTSTIRKSRLKGNIPLLTVDKFNEKERGYHETVVLVPGVQVPGPCQVD
jgi:hypothetical protein